jgi:hypothetical protein
MKRRFSIWGREHSADHDVELAQVDNDPQAVLDGFAAKTLTLHLGGTKKKSKVRKFTWLRIVENHDP